MKLWGIVVAAVLVVGVGAFYGFDLLKHQLSAAGEKAGDTVTEIIGRLEVQKQKAKTQIENVAALRQDLNEKRVRAEVRAEQFTEEAKQLENKQENAIESIRKLRDYLDEDQLVTLGGQEYSVDELEAMLRSRITEYKADQVRLQQKQKAAAELRAIAQQNAAQVKKCDQRLADARAQMKVLEAKIETARLRSGFGDVEPESIGNQLRKLDEEMAQLNEETAVAGANSQPTTPGNAPLPPDDVDDLLNDDREELMGEAASILGETQTDTVADEQSPAQAQ